MREIPSPTMPFAGLDIVLGASPVPVQGGPDRKPMASGTPPLPDLHSRAFLFRKKRCWIARVFAFIGR